MESDSNDIIYGIKKANSLKDVYNILYVWHNLLTGTRLIKIIKEVNDMSFESKVRNAIEKFGAFPINLHVFIHGITRFDNPLINETTYTNMLHELGDTEAKIILLRFKEGKSLTEIGNECHVSIWDTTHIITKSRIDLKRPEYTQMLSQSHIEPPKTQDDVKTYVETQCGKCPHIRKIFADNNLSYADIMGKRMYDNSYGLEDVEVKADFVWMKIRGLTFMELYKLSRLIQNYSTMNAGEIEDFMCKLILKYGVDFVESEIKKLNLVEV